MTDIETETRLLFGKKDRRIEELEAQLASQKTLMTAAKQEIDDHWDAHCSSEGYGPVNLMRRLEDGMKKDCYPCHCDAHEVMQKQLARAEADRKIAFEDFNIVQNALIKCQDELAECQRDKSRLLFDVGGLCAQIAECQRERDALRETLYKIINSLSTEPRSAREIALAATKENGDG